ncbi:MAG: hypothetical protein RL095_2391 [Verrucomicrobiota bacterium]|jgi:hypothetical protein
MCGGFAHGCIGDLRRSDEVRIGATTWGVEEHVGEELVHVPLDALGMRTQSRTLFSWRWCIGRPDLAASEGSFNRT